MVAMIFIGSVDGLKIQLKKGRLNLTEILEASGTDKVWRHGYHRYYESKLAPYRDIDGLRILEIGADSGKSLNAWMQYFGNPAAIHGIAYDVDPVAARNEACSVVGQEKCGVVNIFSLDQSNKTALEELKKKEPDGWDVIIDDGSHVPSHQLISFQYLFPKCRAGGLYVIEDIETSYVDDGSKVYGYKIEGGGIGKRPPGNAIEMFKDIVDVVNRRHFGHPELSVMEGVDKDIAEVSFVDGMICVFRKPNDEWDTYPVDKKLIFGRKNSNTTVKEWLASRGQVNLDP